MQQTALSLSLRLALAPVAERRYVRRTDMGIDVRLKGEGGNVVAEVGDANMVLSRAAQGGLSETRLLRYLMPYGNTVFNQAQADDLEDDIQELIRAQAGTALGDLLTKILPLVERLTSAVHLYLWFIGD
jgi:hypothetical protein